LDGHEGDAMAYENYYEILGIDKEASPEMIKRAYRKKISEFHPDHNVHRTAEAEEKTKILNNAYSVLSSPNQRKQYDRMLRYTRGKDYGKGINDQIFREKTSNAPSIMKGIMTNVKDLYAMHRDALTRKYKLHYTTLGLIGGGLLYFVMPFDAIPDFIPFAGFIDDLAVLTAIITAVQDELLAYRLWRENVSVDR
jgi:curved DNA-binding protein CbpA